VESLDPEFHLAALTRLPNPTHQSFDVGDRRLRQNAMAKVEDQRPCPKRPNDVVDRIVEPLAAGNQGERIEIALYGRNRLDAIGGKSEIHSRIKPNCVSTARSRQFDQM
jgi:hypothetical protein